MKKVGQIIIASICIGLSLICIIATISSYSKSMKQYSFDDATENADVNIENICDDSTLIFHSWDEYLAYFSSLPSTVSNTENSEELVTIPEELPDDIELSSIHVNDECTLLTYSVSRNFNLLNYDTSDDVIMEMTNTFIAKKYRDSHISNYRLYAQNLAVGIGADPTSLSTLLDVYAGNVYADIYNTGTGLTERVQIGTQKVIFQAESDGSNDGEVWYYFVPLTISEAEFNELAGLN